MRASLAAGAGAAALALVVVALTAGIGGSGPASGAGPSARGSEESGRAVFVRMGCGSCHTLAAAGSAGSIGPNLDSRLAGHNRASLIARITASPSLDGGIGAMPTDFASRMSPRALDALVRFLLAARSGPNGAAP
jgi:cytochrome c oxidase subunit 2